MTKNKQIAVSFSGGRTSAYMLQKLCEQYGSENVISIFANTSAEFEETLLFVKQVSEYLKVETIWLEADIQHEKGVGTKYRVVDFDRAKRNGEIFQDMIDVYGLPNKSFPHCTRELKTVPIRKFRKEVIGYDIPLAIGYRIDERTRINRRKAEKENWFFPLVDEYPTWSLMVRSHWAKMPFDLQLKDYEGNCTLCWKKSKKKRLTLLKERPGIENMWQKWEEDSDYVFDRDGLSIAQLKEMSVRPFREAIDELEKANMNPTLDFKCMCFA